MTVETQAGYIMLSDEIALKSLELQKTIDDRDDLNAELAALKTALARNKNSLAGWQAAGNSNLQNKIERIQYYGNQIQVNEADIKVLNKELQEIGYEITTLENLVKSLKGQLNAFINAYKEAVISGKSADQAAAEAESAASAKATIVLSSQKKKTMMLVGGVIAVGIIIIIIINSLKK